MSFLHALFYKQLGSGPSPQSCLLLQDFECSKFLNGCIVVWRDKKNLSVFQWFYRSLLNYVSYVVSCPPSLLPYVLWCLTCLVHYMLSCPMCLVCYVFYCLTHLALCLACSGSPCYSCQTCFVVHGSCVQSGLVSRALWALFPYVPSRVAPYLLFVLISPFVLF